MPSPAQPGERPLFSVTAMAWQLAFLGVIQVVWAILLVIQEPSLGGHWGRWALWLAVTPIQVIGWSRLYRRVKKR